MYTSHVNKKYYLPYLPTYVKNTNPSQINGHNLVDTCEIYRYKFKPDNIVN